MELTKTFACFAPSSRVRPWRKGSAPSFAIGLARHGKIRPVPFPPHVAADVKESRALYNLVKTQGRDGALGIVQGERAIARIELHGAPDEAPASRVEPQESGGSLPGTRLGGD